MTRDPVARKLGCRIGEHRKTARVVVVELPITVTIEWPDRIPYSDEVAKGVACSAVSSRYGRDVGAGTGKIVWAECSTECCDDEAVVIEGGEIDDNAAS